MQDCVEYAIQTSHDHRKYMKEDSDNKKEENLPPLKLNSLLLYEASFMYLAIESVLNGTLYSLQYHALKKPVISGCQEINSSAVPLGL